MLSICETHLKELSTTVVLLSSLPILAVPTIWFELYPKYRI